MSVTNKKITNVFFFNYWKGGLAQVRTFKLKAFNNVAM